MLEKLKNLAESAKGLILWVITPLVLVVTGAIYLYSKMLYSKTEVEEIKAADVTTAVKEQANETDKNATIDLDTYKRMRELYLKSQSKKP